MRVCRTVQGEQPISAATSEMFIGSPKSRRGAPLTASGSRKIGPGCPGQCLGQHWPGLEGGKGRKRAGFAVFATPAFGSEAELLLVLNFGNLMSMAVSVMGIAGTSEQSCEESSEKMR